MFLSFLVEKWRFDDIFATSSIQQQRKEGEKETENDFSVFYSLIKGVCFGEREREREREGEREIFDNIRRGKK